MHTNAKGIQIPDVGDDILGALETTFGAIGTISRFDSPAAMRSALSAAETAGHPATPAHALYGDINGIIYTATGEKASNGVYIINPVNQVDWKSEYGGAVGYGQHWINLNTSINVTSTDLGVKNYDRVVMATGSLWARVHTGEVDLEVTVSNAVFKARLPNVSDGNVSVTGMAVVRAGASARVNLRATAVRNGEGGNSQGAGVTIVSDEWTRITALAFPISMS